MALNPFFLQGTASEQRLVQNLINEHLGMFGVEVTYIPRKFVSKPDEIWNEVQSSKFDDNFSIEAYVNNFDGYGGQGDVLTKFGMSLKDEITLTISKDKYEDFISPFLAGLDDGTDTSPVPLASRPREGDLIYFPLGQRLFEVKFVEHENPFYQLGKNYVYELQCELFELEDEVLDTSIEEIDTQIEQEGYITRLKLIGIGRTASATSSIQIGGVREIFLNDDGSGFTSTPTITFSPSYSGNAGDTATAVGILTTIGGVTSIDKILMTNAGAGYGLTAPSITISGGGGIGAAATCSINSGEVGVSRFLIVDGGIGYDTVPTVNVYPVTAGAAATSVYGPVGAGNSGHLSSISVTYGGVGYASTPTVSISTAPDRQNAIDWGTTHTAGSGYPVGQAVYKCYADSGIGTDALVQITVDGSGNIQSEDAIIYGGHSFNYGYNVCTVVGGNNDGKVHLYSYGSSSGYIQRGENATAEASINAAGVVTAINITNAGYGYTNNPTITISNEITEKFQAGVTTAIGIANIGRTGSDMVVKNIYVDNAGIGYTVAPSVVISSPQITGVGTFIFNEIIIGETSRTEARVKHWDQDTKILKISNVGIGSTAKGFQTGEVILGQESGAKYTTADFLKEDIDDKYNQGDEFELEADKILDFTEVNPFGVY